MDPQPTSVAVAGSCITRDNFNRRFNPEYKSWFSCDAASNQTSVIALMSPPITEQWEARKTFTKYDAWNINDDLTRGFLREVAAVQPAYVILDFFADVHFGVVRVPDGRYFTDNRWKHRHTSLIDDFGSQGELQHLKPYTSAEYFTLWCDALDRFAAFMAEASPDTAVIVHRGFNARRVLTPEHPEGIHIRRHKPQLARLPKDADAWWARFDDYAVDTHGWESIDLRDGQYPTVHDHPWGPFFVHYSLDYYPQFLAELNRIHMARASVSDGPARLAHMRSARHQEATRMAGMAAAWRAVAENRRDRLDELESLGPLRAARFAVGQRLRQRRGQ